MESRRQVRVALLAGAGLLAAFGSAATALAQGMPGRDMASGGNAALIDNVLIVWFVLTALSVVYVAWDAVTNNPELKVMRVGWILVTLYTGLVGAALYVLSCQEPATGQHGKFITSPWKQALGSTIHCIAGDATGILVAAAITSTLGLPMWLDTISEYVFGFAFGLLIFQALFMKNMLGGSYLEALKRTLLPEWLSMNTVMAGMVPVMVILMSRDPTAMEVTSARFWGVMSLATLVGTVIAYPVNFWLVQAGLKHGMGTERALGRGGHSLASEQELLRANSGAAPHPAPAPPAPATASGQGTHDLRDTSGRSALPADPNMDVTRPGAGGHAGMPVETGNSLPVSRSQVGAVTVLTLLVLAAGVLLAALFGDFAMSAANMSSSNTNMSGGGMPGMDLGGGGGPRPTPVSVLPQLRLSGPAQMNGMVRPPGMIMMPGMRMEALGGMAAVDPTQVAYTAPADARGDQPLVPRMDMDSKVFVSDNSSSSYIGSTEYTYPGSILR